MKLVDNLSDEPFQTSQITLADGSILVLTLRYLENIRRWMLDVSHPLFNISGMNLCNHYNLLRPWRNKIPFGLACISVDGIDPVYVTDFSLGRVSLFVLSSSEVQGVEQNVLAGSL